MPREIFTIAYGDEELDVEADSPEQALALVQGQAVPAAPAPPAAPEPGSLEAYGQGQAALMGGAMKGLERVTPLGSIKEIYGQLSGERPSSGLKAGLAAADLASLGLSGKVKTAAAAGGEGLKGIAKALGIGAASQGAALTAEEAGAPAAIAVPLGIGAGILAGRKFSPEMGRSAVPVGQEPAALAATMQKMGIGIPAPASARPRDVMSAFGQAKAGLGSQVGAAKEAALQTEAAAPDVVKAVQEAAKGGLARAGVPVIEGNFAPGLATEGRAPAEMVLGKLGELSAIPEGATGSEALKLANNVLEGMKKVVADSPKAGTGLAGRTAKSAISEWQKAIDSLGPADKVAAAKAVDSAFSKLATLEKMATQASGTMVGGEPAFNPRKFQFMWENLKPNVRARFTEQEIALLDGMLTQRPGWINKGIKMAVDFAKQKGFKNLSFHPPTRFYQESQRAVGPIAATQATAAQGRQETERPTTFYNSLSR